MRLIRTFERAMGFKWNSTHGMHLLSFLLIFILVLQIHGCSSLNSEGLALLEFRAKVSFDPSGELERWNPNDSDPCRWAGVSCLDGLVVMLNLSEHYLEGILAPDLGNLTSLKVLDLSKNQFSGTIPAQLGQLTSLEVLDLRDNDLSGTVPLQLGELLSLRSLLLCNNKLSIPMKIQKLSLLTDLQFDEIVSPADEGLVCSNRKFGLCIWHGVVKPAKKSEPFFGPTQWGITHYLKLLTQFTFGHDSCNNLRDSAERALLRSVDKEENDARRVLAEESSNLMANPPSVSPVPSQSPASLPSRSSGSFPAVPKGGEKSSPATLLTSAATKHGGSTLQPSGKQSLEADDEKGLFRLIAGITISLFLLFIVAIIFLAFKRKAARTIGPWKTGLSSQLQKAFITGVPKLNRAELETACEDFSNIINIQDGVTTLYKGTLSSGVEIAVVSTAISSLKDWSKRSELSFMKKIESLSRVNHKNFVNLIGYCEEDEPFTRMMVFEYAPNGSLFEHLHVKELEHLDWHARTRVIMGIAYCLQYMHDLNPPVFHSRLTTRDIFLTDDYAAKIGDVGFWAELIAKSKNFGDNDSEHSEAKFANLEANIHSFGVLLLEIITGKHPHLDEEGHVIDSVLKLLNDKRSLKNMVDPTLKNFKENELEVVCEVIRSCIEREAHERPSMKEVLHKLRQAIDISPDAATPRLSPLWWAELEILSAEAA